MFCLQCDQFLAWPLSEEEDDAVAGPRGADGPVLRGLSHDQLAEADARDKPAADVQPADPAPPATPPTLPAPPIPAAPPTPAAPPISAAPQVEKSSIEAALVVLAEGRQLAADQQRPDLAQRLDGASDRLVQRTVPVVVVGEFKRGKSTLINALLQKAVCPVDADLVTAVPMTVRWGRVPAAYVHLGPLDESVEMPVDLDRVAELVMERDHSDTPPPRMVEVALPHPLLRSGLSLVDTPGVGGLDSAYGLATLGALDTARAALFVTDASQELTGPELDFLKAVAAKQVGLLCVVITKTDIHPAWRRVTELNTRHLADAGLDLPIFPVSSFLRLREDRDAELARESGFGELVRFLDHDVVRQGTAAAAAAAARDVAFVARQLSRPIDAAGTVLAEPGNAGHVLSTLTATEERTARLKTRSATWQQTLADGVAEMTSEVEHDLQRRLRNLLHEAEKVIKEGNPKDTWPDITAWLQKQVVTAAVANRHLLASRADELVERVGEAFDLEADFDTDSATGPPRPDSLAEVVVAGAEGLVVPGGQLGPLVVAGRTAVLVPLTLISMAVWLPPVALFVIAPLGLVLGAGIGHQLISNERKRQLTYRRQLASAAARKYVEEASWLIAKESRDAMRRTSIQMRDGFQEQAVQIHRSSVNALAAAEQAVSSPSAHTREIVASSEAVQRLSIAAGRLASPSAVAVARG